MVARMAKVLLSLVALSTAAAELRFATSYGDHMVLQQAPKQAVVWGRCTAADCASVKVSLATAAGQQLATVAAAPGGEAGTFIAKLPATAGGDAPHTVTATVGGATATLTDVLFGDVWVCSGQSNMAFLLENAFNGSALIADADAHPSVRLFTSKKTRSNVPLLEQPTVEQRWAVSSANATSDDGCPKCPNNTFPPAPGKDAAGGWASQVHDHYGDDNWLYMSAVCYIYGRSIQAHTGKPVGLVNTNWGGTPVEFWMSDDAEAACATKDASAQGAGGAYNGMIKPLLNMTIHGAIWYQGESNQGDKYGNKDQNGLPMITYGCRFPAMIADWRAKWHGGSMGETAADFPFGFVNLAPWKNNNNAPASVRWAQTAGYGMVPNKMMPNTFTAIALDLTDNTSPYGSVHIRDKTTVGERLAAAGIALVDGSKAYVQGPTVKGAVRKGSAVQISFSNVGTQGLEVKAAGAQDVAFEVCVEVPLNVPNCNLTLSAGASGGGWAAANVSASDKSTVTITMSEWASPRERAAVGLVHVRYAWAAVPFQYKAAVLYGGDAKGAMLPAGAFVVVAK